MDERKHSFGLDQLKLFTASLVSRRDSIIRLKPSRNPRRGIPFSNALDVFSDNSPELTTVIEGRISNMQSHEDVRDLYLSRSVKGKTFAEIGGLWGTVQERVSVAQQLGATQLTMIDILPPLNPWWGKFAVRMEEKGVSNYSTLCGDIMTMPCGPFDVTHSSGILYHLPSPLQYLIALRKITREHCIMTSASIPERIENKFGVIDLSGGEVIFVPSMTTEQKQIFAEHYCGDSGAICYGINGEAIKFTTDNYVPWWWLLTGKTLVAMAESAGWQVLDCVENWDGRAHTLFLRNTGRIESTTIG